MGANEIIYIILAISGIAILLIAFKCWKGQNFLRKQFERCNCIVFGKKGTGKDLLFNKVINLRKRKCYANIPYNEKYAEIKQIKDFTVAPNTYQDFLNDKVQVVKKLLNENQDFYISDGGIALPSQYQGDLCKLYPSLPIYYALSRHLTNSNIHINTQNLGRVWDKLREQADGYFKTKYSLKLGPLIFTKFIYYDEYESAKANILPYKTRMVFIKAESRANREEYEALHGEVRSYLICQLVKNVKYDSRYFHSVLYGESAPQPNKALIKHKKNSNK